jgi:hypothetical protein
MTAETIIEGFTRFVIASEAKQSILLREERMDCFVASLPCANASRLSQATTGVDGGSSDLRQHL